MYAPYPISLNPFKSALYATFLKERGYAVKITAEGGFSDNEQLVWVLWKILKGDGNDVHPLSLVVGHATDRFCRLVPILLVH